MSVDKKEQGREFEEPGRTQTEAEGGERTAQFPDEETHTQDHAEGDPATIDEALEEDHTPTHRA